MSSAAEGPFAVIGLGLVGGSLAKALSARGHEVLGVDADETTRRQALADGAVRSALVAPGAELARARTVVLCVPVGALDAVLTALKPHLSKNALLSDVIGVKALVAERVQAVLPGVRFIGAHPMAGGELGGYAHSSAELFKNKRVAVCGAEPTAIADLWKSLGAEPAVMTPDEHDRVVAATSHLPYLSALALVNVASRQAGVHLAGKGFFDATRRADFAPEVMAAVVAKNPHAAAALRAQAAELLHLAEIIEDRPAELERVAGKARDERQRLQKK